MFSLKPTVITCLVRLARMPNSGTDKSDHTILSPQESITTNPDSSRTVRPRSSPLCPDLAKDLRIKYQQDEEDQDDDNTSGQEPLLLHPTIAKWDGSKKTRRVDHGRGKREKGLVRISHAVAIEFTRGKG